MPVGSGDPSHTSASVEAGSSSVILGCFVSSTAPVRLPAHPQFGLNDI